MSLRKRRWTCEAAASNRQRDSSLPAAGMRVPLVGQRAFVTLDGSGNGTCKLGPLSAREVWWPDNAHVSTGQAVVTNEAVCKIYVGDAVSVQNFRDNTFTGSSGDSTDKIAADRVSVGQWVWAVWSGGDAGAVGTLNVTGNRDV